MGTLVEISDRRDLSIEELRDLKLKHARLSELRKMLLESLKEVEEEKMEVKKRLDEIDRLIVAGVRFA